MKKYIPSIVAVVTVAVAFLISYNANAQSCKTEKTTCVKEQTLGSINAEILALEKELANIEKVAKANNINLGAPYNYMILNKTADVAVLEEKETAKK